MGDNDIEPGWNGLDLLLWPVLKLMQLKVWLHNKIHPDDHEEL